MEVPHWAHSRSSRPPHSWQKRAPGGVGVWQMKQVVTSRTPHCWQNLAPGRLMLLHWEQRMSRLLPHSGQNLAPAADGAWQ